MKIGIDLDDTLLDFTNTFSKFYFEKYGKKVKFEEFKTYNYVEIFGVPLKEIIDLIDEMNSIGIGRNLPFCEYAKEAVLDLAQEHEIFFITSRTIRRGTLEYLGEVFPEIKFKLIFSSNSYVGNEGKTKGEICFEEGIEDDKKYAKNIAEKGIKVILLDKPWNEDYEEHPNVIKVNNWKEVADNIK